MRMHMPDRLARRSPILHRHRQRRRPIHPLQHPAHAPGRHEQVGRLGAAEIAKSAGAGSEWADERVAG